jgi:DNA-directed RNA polymerase subunit RPC12/RpoP
LAYQTNIEDVKLISCRKCKGRMFVDRQYSNVDHVEIYCVRCGSRRFFHPPSESREGAWILLNEKSRAKHTITSL